jgi:N-acetylglucosamine-6-phosphate deacetylase
MMLAPARLLTENETLEGAALVIEYGRIADILPTAPASATKLDGLLVPGFIDIQVNGGGGAMFNDDPSPATLATMAAAHARFGVTSIMATLVSDNRAKIARAFDAVTQAIAAKTPGLLGLHLEGPWLSDPKRGVHPSRFLRPLDDEDMALLTQKRAFPVMVTVAPEQATPAQIDALVEAGVTVSLGHTAASADEVIAAINAGASGFTHLFNAMPPMEGRKPGPIGVALSVRTAWTGLILDGIHVDPISARAAFVAKGARKLILVSDAMSTIGAADPSMMLFGERIEVRDGALRTASGTLAGAHLELGAAMRNAVLMLGATGAEAIRMASLTPAEFLRVDQDRGRLTRGARADLTLLDKSLNVANVWIGGEQVR